MSNNGGLSGPTITVYGGRALTKIDETEIRGAANRLNHAADRLARARLLALDAASSMDRAARTNLNQLATNAAARAALLVKPDPAVARAQAAADEETRKVAKVAATTAAEARATAKSLQAAANECQQINVRLLKAAGLYVEKENKMRQFLVNATFGQPFVRLPLLKWAGGALGYSPLGIFGVTTVLPVLTKLGQTGYADAASVGAQSKTALQLSISDLYALPKLELKALSSCAQWALTQVPGLESFIDGFAFGVNLHFPMLANEKPAIEAAAGTLSLFAGLGLAPTEIYTHQYYPGLTPSDGVSVPRPQWADTSIKGLDDALDRIDQTYPPETAFPGHVSAGLPEGTISIERVVHEDGRISWNIIIPGTQGFAPDIHPHDGITDLELMAGEWCDIQIAVTNAMKQAGVKPGDGVVLVGHSLGGIAAAALAADPKFNQKYQVKGVMTAGSPVAAFDIPPEIPVVRLETAGDIVHKLDGKDGSGNMNGPNQITIVGDLASSTNSTDRANSSKIDGSHAIESYRDVLAEAKASGNIQVLETTSKLEKEMMGVAVATTFWTSRRLPEVNLKAEEEDEDDDE